MQDAQKVRVTYYDIKGESRQYIKWTITVFYVYE